MINDVKSKYYLNGGAYKRPPLLYSLLNPLFKFSKLSEPKFLLKDSS